MSLLLYFVLRKFFVELDVKENEISLTKGLIIKRAAVLPISAVVRVTVRRTLVMRLFGAREVTVFTLGGKLVFFLSKNETLPLFHVISKDRAVVQKPRFLETAFGAFVDTRALGGLFVFSAALRRVSAVFGGEYFDRVITALTNTANDLERALNFFKITIPKIAITIGVFALGAWVFAYIKKLLRLSRFRVFTDKIGGRVIITSGVFTLYEHALVPNTAAVRVETLTSLVTRRAPLYLRDVMICPCVKRELLPKTLEKLCGFKLPKKRVKSPKRAFFGHILAPLSWLGVFAAALFAAYSLAYSELLKIALYCGIFVNLYAVVLYLLYMSRSGLALSGEFARITARRGLRLYTAVFPRSACDISVITQSIFQKRTGLCNRKIAVIGDRRYTARQIPKKELPRRTAF